MSAKIKILFSIFLTISIVNAQSTRKQLELKRKKTEEKIKLTQKILSQTQNKKATNLKELKTISKLIESREELIVDINDEINAVVGETDTKKTEIEEVNAQLIETKKAYGNAILQGYKDKKIYKNSLYLFAAKSFNQLLKRVKFIQYLSMAQNKFLFDIKRKKEELENKLKELFGLRQEKETLVQGKVKEVNELEKDKKVKNNTITLLAGKEKELLKDLAQQKKAKENLNAQINQLIAKEIAEAKRKAQELKNKKTAVKTDTKKQNTNQTKEPTLTPEAQSLSDNFAANKGKLPWPVEKGIISEKFGTHTHSQLEQVTIQNNGINIRTLKNSSIRAVQKGIVTAIIVIPGMGNTVLISHGDYFTVYAKLQSVSVKQGQEVSLKQQIGIVNTDEDGITELHFEIWHNQEKQNPEIWLAN